MKRRAFIALLGGAAAWPLAARAQQPSGMRRIGVLMNAAATVPAEPPADRAGTVPPRDDTGRAPARAQTGGPAPARGGALGRGEDQAFALPQSSW